jgi:hypothetical protein
MMNPVFENTELTTHVDAVTLAKIAPGEILIANLMAFDGEGKPLVYHPLLTAEKSIPAITTQVLSHQHIGRQVAMMFVNGELSQPIIVGLIHSPLYALLDNLSVAPTETIKTTSQSVNATSQTITTTSQISKTENTVEPDSVVFDAPLPPITNTPDSEGVLRVDGKRVIIEGQEEITFSCGQASITLTKAGKILLRGTYLQSRSSGVNRILGGSVQVN